MKTFLHSLILSMSFILAAYCGENEVVEKDLRQRAQSESNGTIVLTRFSKTDGYTKNHDGLVYRIIEWKASFKVLVDIWKDGNQLVKMSYWESFRVRKQSPNEEDLAWGDAMGNGPKKFIKGATANLTGKTGLVKTDNGWRVEELSIDSWQVLNNQLSPEALAEIERKKAEELLARQKAQEEALRLERAKEEKERKIKEERIRLARTLPKVPDVYGEFEFLDRCVMDKPIRTAETITYRVIINTVCVTKEVIKITIDRGPGCSTPVGQSDTIWFDCLTQEPSFYQESVSRLDREIELRTEGKNEHIFDLGNQKKKNPADLEKAYDLLIKAIDVWRNKNPDLAKW